MTKKIESFSSEQALLGRIDNLKSQGVNEHDIHVISSHKLEGSALDYTDVKYHNAEGSFGDKFASLFTGEDPQQRAFSKLDLTESEKNEYIREVESGSILLYVDQDETEYNNYDAASTSGAGFAGAHSVTQAESSHPGTEADLSHVGTHADIAADHKENNLNNREERVDMNNEYNNNEFDNKKNHELDEELRNHDNVTDDEKIRLHEERLRVGKEDVQTGEVRIDKDVVEERQEFDVPVSHDEVTIERRRVDDAVPGNDVDFDQLDNDTIRVPLTEERINVEKENVVTEELVIKKNRVQDTAHVSETVRKEEVNIDDTTDNNFNRTNNTLDNDDLTERR